MGHRNNPAHLGRREDNDGRPSPQQSPQYSQQDRPYNRPLPPPQASGPRPQPPRDYESPRGFDEYHVDPYMAGNNTYRDSDTAAYTGPGYYGGGHGSREAGNYEGAGWWDTDYDRAQRGSWHSDDYRRPHYGQQHQQQPRYGFEPRQEPRYDENRGDSRHADQRRDLRGGDRPAGGYGSYGSTDGAYGDVQRQQPQQRYGQHGAPFDPDYHQWRTEQMNKLDADYNSWRGDRYKKFSDEFDSWRSSRQDRSDTDPQTGVNHDIEGTAKPAGSDTGAGKQK